MLIYLRDDVLHRKLYYLREDEDRERSESDEGVPQATG